MQLRAQVLGAADAVTSMAMQSQAVSSSAITYLAYDDETQECQVTFKDGRNYVLQGLSGLEFGRWTSADSVGAYWNANIRGNY
jgi:hypothetical protein